MPRLAFLMALCLLGAKRPDANRLNDLDDKSPYYPSRTSSKLITPQWVGEEGVEAVVVLAIDDMRDAARYEPFLRPILDRLKAIDGRAPLSIMANKVDPNSPQIQSWLKEGVNIDVHTLTHPCPLLQKNDFNAAARNYHDCVDLISEIPNNQPVAFRMPCCDSVNSPSPRFFSEIFNKTTKEGRFLTIDSSVFQRFTADDPTLPRTLIQASDGSDRFRKYLPFPSFVNTINDYPYPYIINRLCWEFPCVVPSDWEAQRIEGKNAAITVDDMKAALDATVIKQGVFNLVFHPHGWIKSEQIVELIDHAVKTHGSKVKFLNFLEAQKRLNANLLGGGSVRSGDGSDHGVRLLDLDNDGLNDVVVGNAETKTTRIWEPKSKQWKTGGFPRSVVGAETHFGFVGDSTHPAMFVSDNGTVEAFQFDGSTWKAEAGLVKLPGEPPDFDCGFRLRDLDRDGVSELMIASPGGSAVYQWAEGWKELPFRFPEHTKLAYMNGDDAGLRFIDINEDGFDDLFFSNDEEFGLYLFKSMKEGWSQKVLLGRPGDPGAIPKIVSGGTDRGAFVHSRAIWWQNEETARLPDYVDRRSFNDLLKDVEPQGQLAQGVARFDSIQVWPGFKVELASSKTLIKDQIALDWSADGRPWVVARLPRRARGAPFAAKNGKLRAARKQDRR